MQVRNVAYEMAEEGCKNKKAVDLVLLQSSAKEVPDSYIVRVEGQQESC